MAKIRETARLRIINPPTSLVVRRRGKAQPKEEVITVTPHPTIWKEALKLADGETRRLLVEEDGSVLITNKSSKGRAPKVKAEVPKKKRTKKEKKS